MLINAMLSAERDRPARPICNATAMKAKPARLMMFMPNTTSLVSAGGTVEAYRFCQLGLRRSAKARGPSI